MYIVIKYGRYKNGREDYGQEALVGPFKDAQEAVDTYIKKNYGKNLYPDICFE
jgi:hypothetical protein